MGEGRVHRAIMPRHQAERRLDTSPPVSDEVKSTTCYMCACRCGVRVHLKDGAIRFIEGNPDHPVNKGVLCAKGSAGIMHQYSAARLKKPLRRETIVSLSPLASSNSGLTLATSIALSKLMRRQRFVVV